VYHFLLLLLGKCMQANSFSLDAGEDKLARCIELYKEMCAENNFCANKSIYRYKCMALLKVLLFDVR
jgi:hypothetical protein